MNAESISITIDGEELIDLYVDLISLEVELDDEIAAMFRLQLGMAQQPDGIWTYLDDERLRVWKPVVIEAGFDDGREELFSGVITHLKPSFASDPTGCTLEIWGMDNGVLMDRVEQLKDWPNKKDSDIATELFTSYGLSPDVEETKIIHDEAVSTIIQRETDIQFLNRLALRNGYECYVEGNTGFFREPRLDEPPQPLLAAHFGEETNLVQFNLEVNALVPNQVAMCQLDRASKEILDVRTEATQQPVLGGNGAESLSGNEVDPGLIVVSQTVATSSAEMEALCRSLFHQGDWFVTGEGDIAGNIYGHVLKPRRTVTIKGIGETYSGIYYIQHVTHRVTPEGYMQHFRVKRNALMPRGDEQFSAAEGLLPGLF